MFVITKNHLALKHWVALLKKVIVFQHYQIFRLHLEEQTVVMVPWNPKLLSTTFWMYRISPITKTQVQNLWLTRQTLNRDQEDTLTHRNDSELKEE